MSGGSGTRCGRAAGARRSEGREASAASAFHGTRRCGSAPSPLLPSPGRPLLPRPSLRAGGATLASPLPAQAGVVRGRMEPPLSAPHPPRITTTPARPGPPAAASARPRPRVAAATAGPAGGSAGPSLPFSPLPFPQRCAECWRWRRLRRPEAAGCPPMAVLPLCSR